MEIGQKIQIDEKFEKETNVVIIFTTNNGVYEKDCASLRNILGKVFPIFLVRSSQTESITEKFLVRKSSYTNSLIKEKNLTKLERELKPYGIALSYIHADMDMIQEFTEFPDEWKYSLGVYLTNENEKINRLVNLYEDKGLITNVYINFNIDTTSVKTSSGDISGNYFRVRTTSEKSEEALKLCHKEIVKTLLEELDKVEEIKQISYYCGDIEHEVKSKISCVLD